MKNYFIAKSRRVRSTSYTSRIENQGVTAYTVYNHMLLPAAFGSLEDSYHHLKEHVQVWDVAGERQVEIKGKDAAKLVQLMTCRDLSKSKIGRCYYCPIIDEDAGMINDPVILKLKDDRWWISIADSDVILFAKGLAAGNKFDVRILWRSMLIADLPYLMRVSLSVLHSISMTSWSCWATLDLVKIHCRWGFRTTTWPEPTRACGPTSAD